MVEPITGQDAHDLACETTASTTQYPPADGPEPFLDQCYRAIRRAATNPHALCLGDLLEAFIPVSDLDSPEVNDALKILDTQGYRVLNCSSPIVIQFCVSGIPEEWPSYVSGEAKASQRRLLDQLQEIGGQAALNRYFQELKALDKED